MNDGLSVSVRATWRLRMPRNLASAFQDSGSKRQRRWGLAALFLPTGKCPINSHYHSRAPMSVLPLGER